MPTPGGYKRESIPEWDRRLPPKPLRVACLAEQDGRCLYCGRRFGAMIYRGIRRIKLRLEWDHFVPHSWAADNAARNFAAACHVCNGLKGGRIFASVEEARLHVTLTAQAKGYADVPPLQRAVCRHAEMATVLLPEMPRLRLERSTPALVQRAKRRAG